VLIVKFDILLKSQPQVIKLFQNSLRKGRLVHTYLFDGAKGTSKLEAAYYFAAMLFCKSEEKPCLECEDCQKILKEQHPDLFLVQPEKGVIKKEQVANLEKEFSMTSQNKRVYIIVDIDKATASAANSLLKFLEEMEGDKYGILTTENLHNVLTTIRSRSQIISFRQVSPRIIAEELMQKGVDPETSNILSILTNNVEECLELIGEGIILDIIELVKKICYSESTKSKNPVLVLYEEGDFLLKEPNRKYHNIFMDLMITIKNDKLLYLLNQKEDIIFVDTIEEISKYLYDFEGVINEVEKFLSFKQRLKYNVNLELFYANLLINSEVK
jgi:DNA polymerase-3 subunit delta'